MTTQSYSIGDAFTLYRDSHAPSGMIAEVVDLLINEEITRTAFSKLNLGLQTPSSFREELLDLLLFYIRLCLKDHVLTNNEKQNIKQMKMLFQMEEGDFYRFRRHQVEEVLVGELAKILDDKFVDKNEALHQVDMQDVFDLSYDQYLELTRGSIKGIVAGIIARITADDIVTEQERKELFDQISALDTVYTLSPEQKKMIRM
jgi:hypothetical protein